MILRVCCLGLPWSSAAVLGLCWPLRCPACQEQPTKPADSQHRKEARPIADIMLLIEIATDGAQFLDRLLLDLWCEIEPLHAFPFQQMPDIWRNGLILRKMPQTTTTRVSVVNLNGITGQICPERGGIYAPKRN